MNVVKDVKQLRSKIKSTQSGRVETELRQQCLQYGVRYIDRDTNYIILENPEMRENTGEEFKMQNTCEFSACGREIAFLPRDSRSRTVGKKEIALAIEMRETPRDLATSAIKPIEFRDLGPILAGHEYSHMMVHSLRLSNELVTKCAHNEPDRWVLTWFGHGSIWFHLKRKKEI